MHWKIPSLPMVKKNPNEKVQAKGDAYHKNILIRCWLSLGKRGCASGKKKCVDFALR